MMKDFVQHRLALERAWQDTIPYNSDDTETYNLDDTEFMPLDEIGEPNFAPDINHSPLDDLYSDVVRFCAIVYVWLLLYLIFTR